MPQGLHESLLKSFGLYVLIGGMPAAVDAYTSGTTAMEAVKRVQRSLLQAYYDDVSKYESDFYRQEAVRHVIRNAPNYSGRVYKYENFAGSGYNSKDMKRAFSLVENAGLIKQIPQTTSLGLPLEPQLTRSKKLAFLDVGLVNANVSNYQRLYDQVLVNSDFTGAIVEQAVIQQLVFSSPIEVKSIFRWERDTNKSAAEVDLTMQLAEKLVAVEIKSESSGRLVSLFSYADYTGNEAKLVRIYGGPPREEVVTYSGKSYKLNSIPVYLTPLLESLISREM